MLKRTMAVVFAIALAMTAGPVAAQTCTVGVFADAAATTSTVEPVEGQNFDVYVIFFGETLVDAVSYSLVAPGLGVDFIEVGTAWALSVAESTSAPPVARMSVSANVPSVSMVRPF
jgi:hypothetical protein